MAGIYIHIPFCKKACHYCNFHFSTTLQLMPDMLDCIAKEAVLQKNYFIDPVASIYLGGGTPSILSKSALDPVLQTISGIFSILPDAEITLETNPDDITEEKLFAWKESGINRLSIGIQSFFEEDLIWMNRAHNATQALQCIELAQKTGFTNITIDLIYGTPGLTDEKWKQNVNTAINFGIPHLSCYALTVEPKTALAKMIATRVSAEIDTDKQARQFSLLTEWMTTAGFEHYEISNFALPTFRSRHNSSYWQGKPYLGLGPSAHSYDGRIRQWNIANNAIYIKSIQSGSIPFESELLTVNQQLNEYIMTSLRTIEGLSLTKVADSWGDETQTLLIKLAQKHINRGHLVMNNHILHLSKAGKFLADGIASDLFTL